ncbi:MAG: DUF4198 domain-containing protein [Pseudomonadota bacterium]
MRLINSVTTFWIFACIATAASAHEFWIDPERYQVQAGDPLKARLVVGQDFNGSSYPYRPSQITRFDIVTGDATLPVEGRIGDNPALDMIAPADGLLVVAHETVDSRLTYTEFAKFEKFVAHKAFPNVIAQHDARGLSRDKFVESYRRYAKSLIAIGDGSGADRAVGLKTEIVALANPYTDALTEMPVRVLLDGQPRRNAQVELFEKAADDTVTITLYETDADGVARFPVRPDHSYLVDAVWAEALPNNDSEAGPVWKTHWTALTFSVPQ